MDSMTVEKMTDVQKQRLRSISASALSASRAMHEAWIEEDIERIGVLAMVSARAKERFQQALRLRGLVVGDVVEVTAPGPYLGRQAQIMEVETRNVVVPLDGISVVANPGHVRLVKPVYLVL